METDDCTKEKKRKLKSGGATIQAYLLSQLKMVKFSLRTINERREDLGRSIYNCVTFCNIFV